MTEGGQKKSVKTQTKHFFFSTLNKKMDSNWLESLVKHPIFELNDQEKLDVKKADFNKTRIDNSTVDFLLQHHNHVLALRDNDLFVAVGSTIRVLNLTAFKDSSLKADKKLLASTHYKVKTLPNTNGCH